MRKGLIYLLAAILLLTIPMMGCTAKYEETIAQLETEIEDLEQDMDDLEDENKELKDTIKEYEARPTVTPTPEPTPEPTATPEPVGSHLGITGGSFVAEYSMYMIFIQIDDDAIQKVKDIPIITYSDFEHTKDDKGQDVYTFTYDKVKISFIQDGRDYVTSVRVKATDCFDDDGNMTYVMEVYKAFHNAALQSFYAGELDEINGSLIQDNRLSNSVTHEGIEYTFRFDFSGNVELMIIPAED